MVVSTVDEAYEKLADVFKSVEGIDIEKSTEADTRINLIDPILKSVLGWLPGQIEM